MSQPQFDPDRQPEWIVENVSKNLGLTCPHCQNKVLVNRIKWLKGAVPRHWENQDIFKRLRACPYCLRTARIPKHRK